MTVLNPEARTMTTMKDLKGFCYPLTPWGHVVARRRDAVALCS